jgi:adenine-specific DNA-methyltransferase
MPKLDWLTRSEDEKTADHVPYRLLEAMPEHSYGDPNAENMLIQGDNLEALKALLPFYAGRVKCIFIDPPYNTRSAFEHYDDNLEHTQWLGMMFPRLELLRDLLTEDGSIWVTIDDNEAHYLKVIMDEVFGRKNFVANCIWQKKFSPQPNAVWLSDSHDHVLAYARNKTIWRPNLLSRTSEANSRYANPDNDPRGIWTSGDLCISLTGGQRGAQYARTGISENLYTITAPSGRKIRPSPGTCWRVSAERFEELLLDNRIWFGANGSNVPRLKRFLNEVQEGIVAMTIWLRGEVGDNQEAKREATSFNRENIFATPKPERLLQRILHLSTDADDLVLDSFLGSATTSAVAHKMGRRYIGIEMGEHAITHCVPRLKKVVDGEQGGISEAVDWKGGGGFHFYKLGNPIFDEQGHINPAVRFDHLAAHIWFAETRTPLPHKRRRSPLLGVHEGTAYYLLFNGILGDKRPDGGNVLTRRVLDELPAHNGPRVIYGEGSRMTAATLKQLGILFKQTPYDVKAR